MTIIEVHAVGTGYLGLMSVHLSDVEQTIDVVFHQNGASAELLSSQQTKLLKVATVGNRQWVLQERNDKEHLLGVRYKVTLPEHSGIRFQVTDSFDVLKELMVETARPTTLAKTSISAIQGNTTDE